uniref:site-specific DNA-methyltransferase (adenine-specific) n=1 Tax=Candidatus Kentrum sp. TUN TaxID=2126343 RepID=A0A450ZCI6_9GAMM|nr:MAG: Predicted helicase [Candidatus Kentron sp. TUN]
MPASNNPAIREYLKTLQGDLDTGKATEHTHRPALQRLLESLLPEYKAINEPRRIEAGAPDYVVQKNSIPIGYVEAKDIGVDLHKLERDEQLKRYRGSLHNLIFTDYLEFRWYVNGEPRQEVRLARIHSGNKIKTEKEGIKAVEELLRDFLNHRPQGIKNPEDLARRMARLAHIIREIIIDSFENHQASPLLQGWREAFAKVLIEDLALPDKTPDFADMFAQTLAYGLFTARVMDTTPEDFSRQEAQYLIPKSNPFLREFFVQISGPQLDDEPFACFVDDLVNLLANTDMDAVLTHFGGRPPQEDPVIHFYETFLAAYDPKLREARGVYYTPESVVSYIVRSVDHVLKTRFDCPQGLADSTTIKVENYDPSLRIKGKRKQIRKTTETHKVLILDPATGTGTFLYAVIDHIRQQFMNQGNAGLWPGYVRNHLLPRLFGFELLMAPYAVAHFKLSLQLAGRDLPQSMADQWTYQPGEGERLGVYLTNALEAPHEMTGLPLFTQWVADETNAANEVKQRLPVLVVMGNPPYFGHSANKGKWIGGLLRGIVEDNKKNQINNEKRDEKGKTKPANYFEVDGKPLNEKNPKWLNDDYVKFIRFSQWRIAETGHGVLGFVTNHSYLDNPTFRGMRQSLMRDFDEIYLIDLHGNSKKKETAPDGGADKNVFDIQQGVAIGIFIKTANKKTKPARVFHAELWGRREEKYPWLFERDIANTEWTELKPVSPFYLFIPQDRGLLKEYERYWKVTDIMPINSVGIVTARDKLTIHETPQAVIDTVRDFSALGEEEAREKYRLGKDARDWKVSLAQKDLKDNGVDENKVTSILYRPFDVRYTYYTGKTRGFICMPRPKVMGHILEGENLGFVFSRKTVDEWGCTTTNNICGHKACAAYEINSLFPLYLYPTKKTTKQKSLFKDSNATTWPPDETNGKRIPNLNPAFVAEMAQKLGLEFTPNTSGDLESTFGPEDIFHYLYAIFHCPTYRARYAEFLKIDFPRVPLTSDRALFKKLCDSGDKLVELHLMKAQLSNLPNYPITGDHRVEKPAFRDGKVTINKTQYFEPVTPKVWNFHIGGYQVASKWLKDRKGRMLSFEDLETYRYILAALAKTAALMEEIDKTIPGFPLP